MSDSEGVLVGQSTAPSESSGVLLDNNTEIGFSLNNDPAVIVGMACRLPGDIRSPSGLWDFLVGKKSAQGPVPLERYNIGGYYHPDGNRSGSSNVPGGYFINEDLRQFDNGFFGINNLEATYMDPQQRKLLEVVYECLESSGTTMKSLSGSFTGVYVGNFSVDYQPNQTRDPDYIHRYTSSGTGATIMSNRISHVFNLHGPSFTVDTACSSSIYALHQALNALQTGDCETAIVASANMVLSPELHIMAAKSGVLSPTGTCHTFDASADGYGRAEGVNAIYVKRLSAALRDGNTIRAVIRGSATNASGRTSGISLPSGKLQEAVIRKAYEKAGLKPTDTDYVECHGTGTPVGDPIEVDAVGRCFAPREGVPLIIGSVKSNVGHSEGASGLTSILKVVTAFENNQIPPSQGIVTLNPKLILKERNLMIATKMESWPRSLRRASVNSFGYGGANAHLILESVESYFSQSRIPMDRLADVGPRGTQQDLLVLPVSAASSTALQGRTEQVSRAVAARADLEGLFDLAHTLTQGRDSLRHRGFLLAKAGGGILPVAETAASSSVNVLPFGFVFTGQGAQYAGMAKELLAQSSNFRDTIRALDGVLKAVPAPYAPDWTLEQTLLDTLATSRINEVTRSQPICTAVQIALVDLLRTWGVRPSSVVGHSSGEIGAAYAAGLLSARQAILVAYYRGHAVGTLRSKGAMLAAGLSSEEAKALIESKDLGALVRVACVNAPTSVTIAGSLEGIKAVESELKSQNKFVRKLETGGRAYHSWMMAEVGGLYEQLLRPLFEGEDAAVLATEAEMFSSVGNSTDELRVLDKNTDMAAYWRQNLEQPVQFNAALANLAGKENVHLLEIGPHAALKGPIQQIRKAIGGNETSLPYSSTLVRGQDASVRMKTLAGSLFTYGHALDWTRVNGLPESGLKTVHDLGPYPWDYSAGLLWSEPRASMEQRNRKHIRHELLGTLALTGNGIDFTWRNILKPSEMPWIKDHKLEDQVIFPAAAYLALAIEAVSRITGVKDKPSAKKAFDFRNVSIAAALNVPEENDPAAKDLELHTTMSPRRLSGASVSNEWYEFAVSSWAADQTTTHCTGSVRVTDATAAIGDADCTIIQNTECFGGGPSSRWYKQWSDEGFCFGPHFQSLTQFRTDNELSRREAIALTRLRPQITSGDTDYRVHPITIDAAIQAAIWSSTSGEISTLKAWFPVFFPECRIQAAESSGAGPEAEGQIHARSEETGFANRRMSATLSDTHGTPVVNFRDVRIALYTGKKVDRPEDEGGPLDVYMERQPTLRVRWKPDVSRLAPRSVDRLKEYVANFMDQLPLDLQDDETMAAIGALLDLAGHKNPRMRVLELGGDALGYKAKQWLGFLDAETAFKRCKSWDVGGVDEGGKLLIEGESSGPFDVILVPTHATTNQVLAHLLDQLASLVADQGIVVTRRSKTATQALKDVGFDVVDAGKQVLLAVKPSQRKKIQDRNALLVHADKPGSAVTDFAGTLTTYLRKSGAANVSLVAISDLDTVEIHPEDICISLLEMEREFLATISPQDTDRLHAITDVATDLVWATGADMLGDTPDPNLTLSNGLSRALMLEQPALRFIALDLGPVQHLGDQDPNVLAACEHVVEALSETREKDDCEFIASGGLLHISRYGPDFTVNSLFRRRVGAHTTTPNKRPLSTAHPARLSVARVGAIDTIYFQQLSEQAAPLPAGFVDIEVRAVGLSPRDVSAMLGFTETRDKTTAFDISGVVTATGAEVDHVAVGDRVIASFPHQVGTVARGPAAATHKLLEHDDWNTVPALLNGYATGLHAINDRAHLRPGESILIHDGTDGLGLALITLARQLGATVYTTTVDSTAKRSHLVRNLGIPETHVFNLTDSSFVSQVMKATDGKGVDVIINSSTSDVLHDSLRCLAEFGRFVNISSGRELEDAGKLDASIFRRSATFTAFDRSDLFYAKDPNQKPVWDRLVAETLALYRTGFIEPPPIKVFDTSKVVDAYRLVANSKETIGNIVLSMFDPQARVPVAPALYLSLFDPEKVYLLVGCLGGLGRSLSSWMMKRGARRFVFLGRSGADKPSARQLVTRLEKTGASVDVVRGDIANAADVTAAVEACLATQRPIGGVVQAAMGLHEALFTSMSNKAWHTGIDPKWRGTWNLHNALEGHDDKLDFFLLTSSVSGTVGTATESNYCAANGFLDAFARWRRTQGKPAVSIGLGMISEVGYLHENPEIEALLLRKGIQPINEEEMLQIVDLALGSEKPRDAREAHLLTGLESAGIRKLAAQGFDVSTHGVLTESRASVLLASLQAEKEAREGLLSGDGGGRTQSTAVVAAPWFQDKVPATLKAAFSSEADAESMVAAILRLIKKRFSSLILMSVDKIDESKPLPDFGVDSMIASEFRTWFWSVFKVDVPFLDIMNARKSLGILADFVEGKIVAA